MMHRHHLPLVLLMLFVAGCGKPGAGNEAHEDDHHDQHDGHPGEEAHEENVVHLTAAQRAASGIEIGVAGPRAIALVQELPGEIVVNADRLAHIVPRFPGIAREVRKQLGDRVQAGEVLAVIESNESLSPYEVKSLIAGTVIEKHITLGEFVRDDSDIYMIADLSTVWVNVTVYARDLPRIRKGQAVTIRAAGVPDAAKGVISYVGPVVGEATRTAVARVTLPNPGMVWRPGLFVLAKVNVEEAKAAVAVPDAAVQTVDGRTVVFVATDDAGTSFEARPTVIGRTDGEWVEVVSGLAAGERCAFRQSFVLKSELGKSEASHEH
jgi:cobalt-zinc-cadmium efflux system membrane fusion protein